MHRKVCYDIMSSINDKLCSDNLENDKDEVNEDKRLLAEVHKEWDKKGLSLYDYQTEGVLKMLKWFRKGHGGINADEMGLGKTCQAITTMMCLSKRGVGPFLVTIPLSVSGHWKDEIERFGCGQLRPIMLFGHEAERLDILKDMGSMTKNTVIVTAHHLFRENYEVIGQLQRESSMQFEVLIVDEAHVIKNQECILTKRFKMVCPNAWCLLLTGTPIQNNLTELYSLFTFVKPREFELYGKHGTMSLEDFVEKFSLPDELEHLKSLLKECMIRRTKEVFKDMVGIDQVFLYHNLCERQKSIYLDILTNNCGTLETGSRPNVRGLNNLQMQLRKAVSHPYLFKGIEPEPFVEGEHIIDASGKFQVLDRLLTYMKSHGHRCLIFSQFVLVLDIVEDFMRLRGYSFERIDGTISNNDRQAGVTRFQAYKTGKPSQAEAAEMPWCFLLSTGAGGQGLNLTAADTVIFLDCHWNPQMDKQAMARCHRIGQNRRVRVIRLVARFTVEQYISAKVRQKRRFTDAIMEIEEEKMIGVDVFEMVTSDLGKLQSSSCDKFTCTDEELEAIIGQTSRQGEWAPLPESSDLAADPGDMDNNDIDTENYHNYDGKTYKMTLKDEEAFRNLSLLKEVEGRGGKRPCSKRALRAINDSPNKDSVGDDIWNPPVRKQMSADGETVEELISSNNKPRNLPLPVDNGDEIDYGIEPASLCYLHGDVTKPSRGDSDEETKLILHCVDEGGVFGSRGVFSALRNRSAAIAASYERSFAKGEISLGDAHLVPINDKESVILLVAQKHDARDQLSSDVLSTCFSRVAEYAGSLSSSVHISRIGHGTNINWYEVEHLLKKHFIYNGVPCFVYHYQRPPRHAHRRVGPTVKRKKMTSPESLVQTGKRRRTKVKRDESMADFLDDDESESSSSEEEGSENEWTMDEDGNGEEIDDDAEEEEETPDENDDEDDIDRPSTSRAPRPRVPVAPPKSHVVAPPKPFIMRTGWRRPTYSDTPATVAVFGFADEQATDNYMQQVVLSGYSVIDQERDLMDAIYALVPPEVADDEPMLEQFRQLFDTDCVLLRSEWVTDACCGLEDIPAFVI